MARHLRRAGYPVVGDPDSILPSESSESDTPGVAPSGLVLELAVQMLADERWKEESR
jgi:hypothetical protein